MARTYRYKKSFKRKPKAKAYAKGLRKQGRCAITQKRSVGLKKYKYFVYATKKKR